MSAPGAPIYLHSSWRSGSTYVWSRFRALDRAYCFFEPLNEHLADATDAFVDAFRPWSFASHPDLDAPYLEEFRPLLRAGGGVAGFPAALTFGRFRADRFDHLPELEDWFDRLRDTAASLGRTAVFGCVRTDLRLEWCRHHLDGTHIALARAPRERFLSCLNQAVQGNTYFLERPWVVLGLNQADPVLAPLARLVGVSPQMQVTAGSDAADLAAAATSLAREASGIAWDRLYRAFYGLQIVAHRSLRSAHLVLDLERMAEDADLRVTLEMDIERLTGLRPSFSNFQLTRYPAHLGWSSAFFQALEAEVEAAMAVSNDHGSLNTQGE